MIPLYIVLYLVVGLIVKWLCERFVKFPVDDIWEFIILVNWPLAVFCLVMLFLVEGGVKLLERIPLDSYFKIRKFFRGF